MLAHRLTLLAQLLTLAGLAACAQAPSPSDRTSPPDEHQGAPGDANPAAPTPGADAECQVNWECGPSAFCDGYRCQPVETGCTSDADCGGCACHFDEYEGLGAYCEPGCVPADCTVDADCGDGMGCDDRRCVPVEAPPAPPATDPAIVAAEQARCAAARQAPAEPAALLAWYRFWPEDPGADASGHARSLEGAFEAQPGPGDLPATALSGRYTVPGGGNPLAGKGCFTVALWVKLAEPTANIKLVSAAWWRGGLDASGLIVGVHYPEAWTDQLGDFWGANSSRSARVNPLGLQADTWAHLVVTYDGERLVEYVDGEPINDFETAGLPIGAGADLQLGHWDGAFTGQGALADVRLYDAAMPPAAVLAHAPTPR